RDRGERQRREEHGPGNGAAPWERARTREQGEGAADERQHRAERVRRRSEGAPLGWIGPGDARRGAAWHALAPLEADPRPRLEDEPVARTQGERLARREAPLTRDGPRRVRGASRRARRSPFESGRAHV